MPERILQIDPRATFDEKPYDPAVSRQSSLMQWGGMRMEPGWIMAVRIFTRIEQRPDDLNVAKLRCQRERPASILMVGLCKQSSGVFAASQPSRRGKIDLRAVSSQGIRRFELAMSERRLHRMVRVGPAIAQEIDQWQLHAALPHDTARAEQPQRLIQCRLLHACIDNRLRHRNNIARQGAMTNRILGYELQQRGVAKIVSAFELDVLTRQKRMFLQVGSQALRVACIEQIDRLAKQRILDLLMEWP